MAVDKRQSLVDLPFLHQARRAVADDLEVVGAFFQQRGPLFSHALVQARRLLQPEKQEADLRVCHVIARQRLCTAQVFLRDLHPHGRSDDFLQLGLHPFEIGRRLLLL